MKNKKIKDLFKDIDDFNLPRKSESFDKVKGRLITGKRFYWYYDEDLEFFSNEGEEIKNHLNDIYSGVVIPIPDYENNRGDLDVENCVVVIDIYPCEMSYPEVDWVSLKRLIDDDTLIEFFDMDSIKGDGDFWTHDGIVKV